MIAALAIIPFVLALWRPNIALALLAAALPAYLVRFTIVGIPTTLLELGLYAAALGIALRLLRARTLGSDLRAGWLAIRPYRWPVLALLVTALLSALMSDELRAGLGAWKAWYVDAALYGFLVVLYRKAVAPRLIAGLAAGSFSLSLWGLGEFLFRHASLEDGRLNSVFGTPNYLALLSVPAIVLLLGAALRWPRWRPWLAAAVTVNLLALALTFSYGGYLGLAVGALVLGLRSGPRVRTFTVAAVAIAGFLFVATQVSTDKFRRLNDLSTRSSTSTRVQIWRTSWLIIRDHPWTGVGPNAFESAYRQTVPRVAFPPLEWLVALPHSFLLAVASQTGVVGVAAFVWLLVAFFRTSSRRRDWLGTTLIAAMVALLAHGLVDTPYFKNDLALLFMGLLALTSAAVQRSD